MKFFKKRLNVAAHIELPGHALAAFRRIKSTTNQTLTESELWDDPVLAKAAGDAIAPATSELKKLAGKGWAPANHSASIGFSGINGDPCLYAQMAFIRD